MELLPAVAALAGLIIYTGARLGLWAPLSYEGLRALMGSLGLAERVALVAATIVGAFYVVQQALHAT